MFGGKLRIATEKGGDLLVTPATGAYGYAMANNYNGVPRPPVVLCRDGNARLAMQTFTYSISYLMALFAFLLVDHYLPSIWPE